jgi:ABC-type nitrate/sulfonate/bicarbonate transport system permease component
MLALQLVIGVGIALLFPLLIYSGVAVIKAPPKPSGRTNLQAETSEEIKQANREQIARDQEALRSARVKYAKILFTVMAPAGLAAILGGYLIGINAIGIGLLTGGILCMVYGYAGYWAELPRWMRFLSVLAGLLMLLFIGASYIGVS